MMHKPHLTPSPQQPTCFKYTSRSLCWISLVKLCKHRQKVLIYLSLVLFVALTGAPCHSFNLRLVKCYPRLVTQGQIPKNCKNDAHSFNQPPHPLGRNYTCQVLSLGQMRDLMFLQTFIQLFLFPFTQKLHAVTNMTSSQKGKTRLVSTPQH